VTTYTDASVSRNKSYSYRVRAYNASGYSAYSNVAAVTTPAKAPSLNPAPGGLTPPSPDSGGIMPITPPPAQPPHSPAAAPSRPPKGHHPPPRPPAPALRPRRARTVASTPRAA